MRETRRENFGQRYFISGSGTQWNVFANLSGTPPFVRRCDMRLKKYTKMVRERAESSTRLGLETGGGICR
jgi:hypothetical protein